MRLVIIRTTTFEHIMKNIALLFLLTLSLCSSGQTTNPFATLKFDKVVMYDFDGGKGSDLAIIDGKGQLAKSVSKQIQLDKSTIIKLDTKLGDKKSYGGGTAACYNPHLGFVYYLNDKVVAHISICLGCNRLHSSINIPAQKQGKVGQGKDAYYMLNGLSKSFRQFLNDLLKKYNFSHQIKEGSAFDQ